MVPPRTPSIFEEEPSPNEDIRSQNARFADELERVREEVAAAHRAAEQVGSSCCMLAVMVQRPAAALWECVGSVSVVQGTALTSSLAQ